jgi:hypothetical protein
MIEEITYIEKLKEEFDAEQQPLISDKKWLQYLIIHFP